MILDGLDEIPQDVRPTVLRALSQQATFRLVFLTRSAEMAEARSPALLQGLWSSSCKTSTPALRPTTLSEPARCSAEPVETVQEQVQRELEFELVVAALADDGRFVVVYRPGHLGDVRVPAFHLAD